MRPRCAADSKGFLPRGRVRAIYRLTAPHTHRGEFIISGEKMERERESHPLVGRLCATAKG
jgi:hypothetical protein